MAFRDVIQGGFMGSSWWVPFCKPGVLICLNVLLKIGDALLL